MANPCDADKCASMGAAMQAAGPGETSGSAIPSSFGQEDGAREK